MQGVKIGEKPERIDEVITTLEILPDILPASQWKIEAKSGGDWRKNKRRVCSLKEIA
jgi:hypothetical protein